MARQQKVDVQGKFTRGLITETTDLTFPEDACKETWDCEFSELGNVTRRYGFDVETDAETFSYVEDADAAWTEFVWDSVAGEGTRKFMVVQVGHIISFYDLSTDNTTCSGEKLSFEIDLTEFIPTDSPNDPSTKPCKYARGNGNLIIVNQYCRPLLVVYDEDSASISVSYISLEQRDFVGLEDGLRNTDRPAYASVAALKTGNPKHYYNLLNQGWHTSDALAQWDAARTDMPANSELMTLYRASQSDAFDNTYVPVTNTVNMQAPRGHYILGVFAPNRTNALLGEGITGVSLGTEESALNLTGASNIGNFTNLANAFDGNSATVATVPLGSYGGKDLGTAQIVSRAVLTNTGGSAGFNANVYLYGKTGAAPSSATDGTQLGVVSVNGSHTGPHSVSSNNTTTAWDHVWVYIAGFGVTSVGEINFYTIDISGEELPITYERPSNVAFYAGRAWYAGINGLDLNNTIFFSQIIEKNDQYGKCYQNNDPTSEDYPELLATDGGYVKIPDVATITHIGAYSNALLVFATNGVWAISGSNKQYFTANNYGVRKISGIGTSANLSFVDVKGLPVWWGESGIYTIKYDPNYDAYEVVSLTDDTIFSFINDIPPYNRTFVKGVYHTDSEQVTWLYNDTSSLTANTVFTYNKILRLNVLSKAFWPQTISTSADLPVVRGIVLAKTPSDLKTARVKYIVEFTETSVTDVTFAEQFSTDYLDWTSYGVDGEIDYDSYFITGYMIDGQAQRFVQSNYVMVYMNSITDSSCFMQGIFDWTTNSSDGKFSTAQQIYSPRVNTQTLKHRRLKVRGKGKALQLHFYSETGKPFDIVGWSIWKTMNAAL
jgi:hypothetical protein